MTATREYVLRALGQSVKRLQLEEDMAYVIPLHWIPRRVCYAVSEVWDEGGDRLLSTIVGSKGRSLCDATHDMTTQSRFFPSQYAHGRPSLISHWKKNSMHGEHTISYDVRGQSMRSASYTAAPLLTIRARLLSRRWLLLLCREILRSEVNESEHLVC